MPRRSEIASKRSLGRLELPDSWPRGVPRLGCLPLPVTASHAAEVERLPWHHRDPFDRLLVAQALVEDAELVTADRSLSAYQVPIRW